MSRAEFMRMFKSNQDCWARALGFALEKEEALIKRCKSYLNTSKAVIDNATAEYRQTLEDRPIFTN